MALGHACAFPLEREKSSHLVNVAKEGRRIHKRILPKRGKARPAERSEAAIGVAARPSCSHSLVQHPLSLACLCRSVCCCGLMAFLTRSLPARLFCTLESIKALSLSLSAPASMIYYRLGREERERPTEREAFKNGLAKKNRALTRDPRTGKDCG